MRRKNQLTKGQVYHIFNRSIADFRIFNNDNDYLRILYLLKYFQIQGPPCKFSNYFRLDKVQQEGFMKCFQPIFNDQEKIIQIIAYCLMPTHIHLILKQLKPQGISIFMGNVLNGYTRYFNTIRHRKGPLWESKFQNVPVEDDEQLLHLMRYIHLNPVTAFLVNKPEDWKFSSYNEFIKGATYPICQYDDLLGIKSPDYKKFVNDRISYQREIAKIKRIIIDSTE